MAIINSSTKPDAVPTKDARNALIPAVALGIDMLLPTPKTLIIASNKVTDPKPDKINSNAKPMIVQEIMRPTVTIFSIPKRVE